MCHDNEARKLKRTWNSESNISSERSSEVRQIEKKTLRLRSRSCSPISVKALNYLDTGNLYESNLPSFVKVIRHTNSSKATQRNITGNQINELSVGENKYGSEELKKKIEERSAKALQREQLKREFHQLLQGLGTLTREKLIVKRRSKSKARVYQRERDILIKKEDRQNKLADTFDTLLHIVNVSQSQSTDLSRPIQPPGAGDSSPPKLNLAEYQQINMSRESSPCKPSLVRRITSIEELTIESPTRQGAGSPSQRSSPSRSSSPRSPVRSPPHSADQASNQFTPTSGNLHIIAKSTEPPMHKKKCKRSKNSPDSSTSYYSPPENLTPSQRLLLGALLIQVNKKALSEDLKKYIKKLLTMSRESIDQLDQSSPGSIDPTRSPPEKAIHEDMAKLSDLTELYAERVSLLVDLFQNVGETLEQENLPDIFEPGPSTSFEPLIFEPGPSTHPPLFESEPLTSYQSPQDQALSSQQRPRVPPPSRVQIPVRKPQQARGRCPQSSAPVRTTRQPSVPVRTTPQPSVSKRTTPQTSLPKRTCPQPAPVRSTTRQPSSSRSTTPQPSGVKGTQPRERRVPRRATTPPMGKHRQTGGTRMPCQQLQQIMKPPVLPDGRTRDPSSHRQRQIPSQGGGIQTPFGLSSNLLPHPRDIFEQPDLGIQQQTDLFSTPRRTERPMDPCAQPALGISERPPSPQGPSGNYNEDDDSVGWAFQGLPMQLGIGPMRDPMAALREFDPEMPSISFDGAYDLDADLRRRGLDDKFDHLRKYYNNPTDQCLERQNQRGTDRVSLDTTLDADAATYPLNVERINALRRKLSKIHDNQYREVLKMLQEDYESDQGRFDILLKQVRSDPFQDPNATLGPVSYDGLPRAPPCERTPDTLPYISLDLPKKRTDSALEDKIDNIAALSILASSQEQFD